MAILCQKTQQKGQGPATISTFRDGGGKKKKKKRQEDAIAVGSSSHNRKRNSI